MGVTRNWTIRTILNYANANIDFLDFINNGAILASLDNLGKFGIVVSVPDEKLNVAGTIKLTGEVNRTSTGTSNMVPIAYGNISSTGAINSGSGNFSVSKSSAGWYTITITGEPFFLSSYTSIVTPIGNAAFVATSSGGGNLLVFTYNMSGVSTDNSFCFVVL